MPSKFKKLLIPGKIQQIISPGNLCDRDTFEYLKGIASDLHVVRGDMDDAPSLPFSKVVQHGPIRIGVIHGHQIIPNADVDALAAAARQLDVDVLVHGHSHQCEARERMDDDRFYVNPGSATGSFSTVLGDEVDPSFLLMDVQGYVVVTYIYRLVDGEVKVEKVEYRKQHQGGGGHMGVLG